VFRPVLESSKVPLIFLRASMVVGGTAPRSVLGEDA
jgi:hypothetical protein